MKKPFRIHTKVPLYGILLGGRACALIDFRVWSPSQETAFRTPLPPFRLSKSVLKFPKTASNWTMSGKSYMRIFDHRR